MTEEKISSDKFADLRQQAEEVLQRQPEELREMPPEDIQHLIHELRVHQIELEMQNEELRRTQRELELSRDRYSDLYDFAPVGYFTVSETGLILEANLTAATMLGLERGRLIKQPLTRFIASEDQDTYYLHRKQLFETREPQVCELRMVRKGGSQFWARMEATVARDSEGQAVYRATMSDITERKRAEEEIRESEKRMRRVVQNMPVMLDALNEEGHIVAWNRECERVTGYSAEAIIGNPQALELLYPDAAYLQKLMAEWAERGNSFRDWEMELTSKDGSSKTVSWTNIAEHFPISGWASWSIGIDITKRKRAEEEVRERVKELTCLYAVSRDMQEDLSVDELCRRAVEHLAPAMWSPEIAVAVIELDGRRFTSEKVAEEPSHGLHAEIRVEGEARGQVEVYYAEQRPFLLPQEQNLVKGVAEILSVWLERKRTEEERERLLAAEREQRLLAETLRDVTLALTAQISLEDVLDEIFRQAQRIVPYSASNVALLEDDILHTAHWQGYETFGTEAFIANLEQLLADLSLNAEIVQSRKPMAISDTQQEPGWVTHDQTAWIKSCLAIPICLRDRVLGLLRLDSDTPGQFSDEDAHRLQPLANAAAIAIENARLYEAAQQELAERRRAEEALRESERKFRLVTETIRDVFWLSTPGVTEMLYISPAYEKIWGRSLDSLRESPRSFLEALHPEDLDQYLGVVEAFHAKGEAYEWEYRIVPETGRVRWIHERGYPVTDERGSVVLMTGICTDITKRKRAEEEIQRHLERIEALREIDRAITSTLDLTEVLDIILEELERVIPYHSAAIFLLSDGTVRVAAARGHPDVARALEVSFLVQDDALIAKLMQEKRPLVLADAQADQRFLARGGTEYVRSWIGIPLIAKGTAVGFLTVDHREPGVYDEESAEMAQAFASQVAVAVENARLYEEAQRELAERKRAQEELQRTTETLRKTLGATIQAMAFTVETRDAYTAGHQRRVADLARAIATEMGLSKERIEGIRTAAVIHDLGKITVPTDILNKPTKLSEHEFGIIQDHPQTGYEILKEIDFPWPVAEIVFQHHERLDGSGYPQGLSGEEIILEARILAVADVVEAMASHRPYRPARGLDEALAEISQNRGILYDAKAVDACLKLFTAKGFEFE